MMWNHLYWQSAHLHILSDPNIAIHVQRNIIFNTEKSKSFHGLVVFSWLPSRFFEGRFTRNKDIIWNGLSLLYKHANPALDSLMC